MEFKHIEAWLIDLDGTLVDTLGDFVAALQPVAQALGAPAATAEQVRRLIGRGGAQLVRDLLQLWQQPESAFEPAWALYERHYREVNGKHASVFEGVVPGLKALRAHGWRLVCVTNKPQANAEALLAALGLRDDFEAVVGGGPNLRPKPEPDALLRACELLGLAPARVGMVGDSANDAEAARAAGCGALVLLRHGYNHGEPIDSVPADWHLDRLDQGFNRDGTSSPCPAAVP
ncbi:phosphoglycolate phosphatase [Inhella inkyongensis]|uniref:phosphoglycolate phosphatase n=1 Tax=Inhella inkyongensis TaxID=392593 RepID=A0A840SA04_9BURK|nr:phosphoglycolate phosphatase [Inhella inkyongensis]MBB5205836.1 phosphoglycolate phosphatase [Inhella inkyongensis]